jgi:hypothetical protein
MRLRVHVCERQLEIKVMEYIAEQHMRGKTMESVGYDTTSLLSSCSANTTPRINNMYNERGWLLLVEAHSEFGGRALSISPGPR